MSVLMRGSTGLAICLAILIAVPTNCCARDDADAAGDQVKLEIAEGTSVLDMLRQASTLLNLQVITSRDKNLQRQINGAPSFTGNRAEVLSQMRSLLIGFEIVLMPIGEHSGRTFFAADVKQSGSILKLRPEPLVLDESNLRELETQSWRFVTTTIQVHNIVDLRNMRTALSKLVTGSAIGQITEAPAASSFVITDFAPNVVAAYRLVKQLDVVERKSKSGYRISVVKLGNAKASDIDALAAKLLMNQPAKRVVANRPGMQNRISVPSRVVADRRTNQIVISGEAQAVAQIEEMIHALDVDLPPKPAPKPVMVVNNPMPPVGTVVVEIKNTNASDIAAVLSQLVITSRKLVQGRPSIVALNARDKLIIAGTEHDRSVLVKLAKELDQMPTDDAAAPSNAK